MKEAERFSLKSRLRSLESALHGLTDVIRYELNVRIHLAAIVIVIAMGMLFQISRVEWVLIILCIGLVVSSEIFNTAVERFVDMVSPQRSEQAGAIKDISAAAVLLSAFVALISGVIIFLPHLLILI